MKNNLNIKPFSKFVAFVTAFTSIAASSGLTAFATEDAKPTFTEGTLTALVNSIENVASVDCRYYSNMPNVPYMKLSEYYTLWTGQELAIANNNDGTYEVTVPAGVKGTYDVENDVVSTEDSSYFFIPENQISEDDPYANLYIRVAEGENAETEATAIELDFGKYDIDLIGDGEELWVPIPTLCDIYTTNLTAPFFMEDTLIFGGNILSDFSLTTLSMTPEHAAGLLNQYANGRSSDLAEYNYNELCFVFDLNYGYPGRPFYTDLIKEKGLDGFLSEANDTTRTIKELLLSTDYNEYLCGFNMLNYYLWDGGHTQFVALPALMDEASAAKVMEIEMKAGCTYENAYDYISESQSKQASAEAIMAARQAVMSDVDVFEILPSGSIYVVEGDTALFNFDQFITDFDAWTSYYYENGEMPKEVISDFYNCLMAANENPAIENFLIDVSTNVGGAAAVLEYIMGLVADVDTFNYRENLNNTTASENYVVDKNLDKVIDSKDEEFKTDLRFGVITSLNSYSCGNLLPAMARENNIMIIGEQSGGGACAVNYRISPDGHLYSFSTGICFTDANYVSVDAGVTPDYVTFKVNEDGTKDFSETYNFETISKYFDEFYSAESALKMGDVNNDQTVDASDASLVLAEYAKVQTGGNPTFTESQTNAADVNKDDVIDASDASKILAYYAAISTGKEPTWD